MIQEGASDQIDRFARVTESLLTALQNKLLYWLESVFEMLPNIVVAFLVMGVFYFLARGAGAAVRRLVHRATRNLPVSELLGTITRISTLMLGLFIALGLLHLDKAVTSLIAGVGVVGLAVGFAFQDIAANFMAGFMMAIRRPFEIGDLVETASFTGVIRRIELRTTTIRTLDGLVVTLPNKDVFQNAITNYTSTPERRMDLMVGVAYDSPLRRVREILNEVGLNTRFRDEGRSPEVFFQSFGDSSIDVVLRVWLNRGDELSYQEARGDAVIRLKEAFDSVGITIPFPIRTLDFGADAVGGQPLGAAHLRNAG